MKGPRLTIACPVDRFDNPMLPCRAVASLGRRRIPHGQQCEAVSDVKLARTERPSQKSRRTAHGRRADRRNSQILKVLRHQRYVLQCPKIPCYARPSLFSKSLWFSRGREYQISFELNRVIIEALHLQQSVESIPYTGAEEFG